MSGCFQAGGTLRRGALYIPRAADELLYQTLLRGEYCYLLAPRQIGKSSLRLRTEERLREAGVRCANVDFLHIGSQGDDTWYRSVLEVTAQCFHLDVDVMAYWERSEGLTAVHRWSRFMVEEFLPRLAGPVVVFFDEIDYLLRSGRAHDDLLAAVRQLYNERARDPELRRLTFCILGVALPSELISDPTRTPFNIGRRIELQDFTAAEAEGFLAGLQHLPGGGGEWLAQVLAWTGGHPYMTQLLCDDLVREPVGPCARAHVAQLVKAHFLDAGRFQEPSLMDAERRFRRQDHPRAAMLDLYRRVAAGRAVAARCGEPVQEILELTGMVAVRRERGARWLQVRNRVFAQVFDDGWVRELERDLIGAELQVPLERWRKNHRHKDFLLRGRALRQALQWAAERDSGGDVLREFLDVCQRRAHVRRGWTSAGIAAAVLLLGLLLDTTFRYSQRHVANAVLLASHRQDRLLDLLLLSELRGQPGAFGVRSALSLASSALPLAVQDTRPWSATGVRFALGRGAELAEQQLLIAANDGQARLWRIGAELEVLAEQRGALTDAQFSPDGRQVLTLANNGDMLLAPVDRRSLPFPVLNDDHCMRIQVAFRPGAGLMLACSDGSLYRWRAGLQEPVLERQVPAGEQVLLSPRGDQMLVLTPDFRGEQGREATLCAPPAGCREVGCVRQAAFSEDGALVVLDGEERPRALTPRARDASCGSSLTPPVEASGLYVSPRGDQQLVTYRDGRAKLWGADGAPTSFDLSEEGALVLSTAPVVHWGEPVSILVGYGDGTARIWRAAGQPVLVLQRHEEAVLSVALSEDGRFAATASQHQVRIWSAGATGAVIRLPTGPGLQPVVSANGEVLVIPDREGLRFCATGEAARAPDQPLSACALVPGKRADTVEKVWVDQAGSMAAVRHRGSPSVCLFRRGGHAQCLRPPLAPAQPVERVTSVGFSPRGDRLALGYADGRVSLHPTDAPAAGRWLRLTPQGEVAELVFTADGLGLLIATTRGTVLRHDEGLDAVAREVFEEPAYSWAIDPAGRSIALLLSDRVYLFDGDNPSQGAQTLDPALPLNAGAILLNTGRLLVAMDNARTYITTLHDAGRGQRSLRATGRPLAMLGRRERDLFLATADEAGSAWLWPLNQLGDRIELSGHPGPVEQAVETQDGRLLITTARGEARLWPQDWAWLSSRLRGANMACLSEEQRQLYLEEAPWWARLRAWYCRWGRG